MQSYSEVPKDVNPADVTMTAFIEAYQESSEELRENYRRMMRELMKRQIELGNPPSPDVQAQVEAF